MRVNTAFSVLMHVNRESRQFAQRTTSSGLRYRSSRLAGCMVPFRLFDPELDSLYFSKENASGLLPLFQNSVADDKFMSRLRHLAFGYNVRGVELGQVRLMLCNRCPNLQSISVVFPEAAAVVDRLATKGPTESVVPAK